MKRIRISSSIANFHDRLRERYQDYGDYKWFSNDSTLFFGMYHFMDYLRVTLCGGTPTIFWCGSDILALTPLRASFVQDCRHVCENMVEWHALHKFGIYAKVQPMFFGDVDEYPVTYQWRGMKKPYVWMTCHEGREDEYGERRFLDICERAGVVGMVFKHISTKTFDVLTERYQATVRLNTFDGFSENIAKALLRGQYAYSLINYGEGVDHIESDEQLVEELKQLCTKRTANEASNLWYERLSKRVEA